MGRPRPLRRRDSTADPHAIAVVGALTVGDAPLSCRSEPSGDRRSTATAVIPSARRWPRQRSVSKYSRHRLTAARTCLFSKAVARDLAALVGIRYRAHVRSSIGRTGTADPEETSAAMISGPQEAAAAGAGVPQPGSAPPRLRHHRFRARAGAHGEPGSNQLMRPAADGRTVPAVVGDAVGGVSPLQHAVVCTEVFDAAFDDHVHEQLLLARCFPPLARAGY